MACPGKADNVENGGPSYKARMEMSTKLCDESHHNYSNKPASDPIILESTKMPHHYVLFMVWCFITFVLFLILNLRQLQTEPNVEGEEFQELYLFQYTTKNKAPLSRINTYFEINPMEAHAGSDETFVEIIELAGNFEIRFTKLDFGTTGGQIVVHDLTLNQTVLIDANAQRCLLMDIDYGITLPTQSIVEIVPEINKDSYSVKRNQRKIRVISVSMSTSKVGLNSPFLSEKCFPYNLYALAKLKTKESIKQCSTTVKKLNQLFGKDINFLELLDTT